MAGGLASYLPSFPVSIEGGCCADLHGLSHHCFCAVSLALWVSAPITGKAAWVQAGPGSQGHRRPVGFRGKVGSSWGPAHPSLGTPAEHCPLQTQVPDLRSLGQWYEVQFGLQRWTLPVQAPHTACLPPHSEERLSQLQSESRYTVRSSSHCPPAPAPGEEEADIQRKRDPLGLCMSLTEGGRSVNNRPEPEDVALGLPSWTWVQDSSGPPRERSPVPLQFRGPAVKWAFGSLRLRGEALTYLSLLWGL